MSISTKIQDVCNLAAAEHLLIGGRSQDSPLAAQGALFLNRPIRPLLWSIVFRSFSPGTVAGSLPQLLRWPCMLQVLLDFLGVPDKTPAGQRRMASF